MVYRAEPRLDDLLPDVRIAPFVPCPHAGPNSPGWGRYAWSASSSENWRGPLRNGQEIYVARKYVDMATAVSGSGRPIFSHHRGSTEPLFIGFLQHGGQLVLGDRPACAVETARPGGAEKHGYFRVGLPPRPCSNSRRADSGRTGSAVISTGEKTKPGGKFDTVGKTGAIREMASLQLTFSVSNCSCLYEIMYSQFSHSLDLTF